MGLNNSGFYVKNTQTNNTVYIKQSNLSNDSELTFSGDTLSLSDRGVVIWNKTLVPQAVESTSPYVFQLPNLGNFFVWVFIGKRFFF